MKTLVPLFMPGAAQTRRLPRARWHRLSAAEERLAVCDRLSRRPNLTHSRHRHLYGNRTLAHGVPAIASRNYSKSPVERRAGDCCHARVGVTHDVRQFAPGRLR